MKFLFTTKSEVSGDFVIFSIMVLSSDVFLLFRLILLVVGVLVAEGVSRLTSIIGTFSSTFGLFRISWSGTTIGETTTLLFLLFKSTVLSFGLFLLTFSVTCGNGSAFFKGILLLLGEIGEELVLLATFLALLLLLTFLEEGMGAVGEGVAATFFFVGVAFELVLLTVGVVLDPGGDLRPAGGPLFDPVGEVLPEDGGLVLFTFVLEGETFFVLGVVFFVGGVLEVTDTLLGTSGGASGTWVRGGGGGAVS